MKTLIAEDDGTSRLLLQALLREFGPSDLAVDGQEAVEAARVAREAGEPYDLICMDIMMPRMDGQEALREIRREEAEAFFPTRASRIVMTTALDRMKDVAESFGNLCDGYLVKPIQRDRLLAELRKLELIA